MITKDVILNICLNWLGSENSWEVFGRPDSWYWYSCGQLAYVLIDSYHSSRISRSKDQLVLWWNEELKWLPFRQEVPNKNEKIYNGRSIIVLIFVPFPFLLYCFMWCVCKVYLGSKWEPLERTQVIADH